MDTKHCLFLGTVLCLAAISESRVIVPRATPEDKSFDEGIGISSPVEAARPGGPRKPVEKDDDDYIGIEPVYKRKDYIDPDKDYIDPDRGVNKKDDKLPGIKPERFPLDSEYDEWSEEEPRKEDDADKSGDENFKKPLDEEDIDKYGNDGKDFKPSSDEDRPIYKGDDESEIGDTDSESEGDSNDKEYESKDDEESDERNQEEDEKFKPEKDDEEKDIPDKEIDEPESNDEKEEEENHEPESDDEEKDIPEEEPIDDDNKEEEIPKEIEEETGDDKDDKNNGEIIPPNGEAGFFSSIFDTPFFNLEQVKKYFSKLDRALGHVFRQTMDEALLLNGTYANTTEEEVDINGKKYIVTKSVIKGGDNHSSMYIEALSAKPKMNESQMMKDIDIKNMTFI